jgi:hypothetical protein
MDGWMDEITWSLRRTLTPLSHKKCTNSNRPILAAIINGVTLSASQQLGSAPPCINIDAISN